MAGLSEQIAHGKETRQLSYRVLKAPGRKERASSRRAPLPPKFGGQGGAAARLLFPARGFQPLDQASFTRKGGPIDPPFREPESGRPGATA